MRSPRRALIGSKVLLFVIGIPLSIWGIVVIMVSSTTEKNLLGFLNLGIIGFILLGSGITYVIIIRSNRAKVFGALRSYERISLAQLSSELKLSKKQTKGAIVYLRAEGKLKASFEPETGDVLVLEVDGEPPIAIVPMSSSGLPEHEEKYKDKRIPKDHNYCSFCGSIVKPEDKFCNNCGSYME